MLNSYLLKNTKFREKDCEIRKKIFTFFRESFCLQETMDMNKVEENRDTAGEDRDIVEKDRNKV